MKNGYITTCDLCGRQIDDYSLADEWFCECGNEGMLVEEDEEEEPSE